MQLLERFFGADQSGSQFAFGYIWHRGARNPHFDIPERQEAAEWGQTPNAPRGRRKTRRHRRWRVATLGRTSPSAQKGRASRPDNRRDTGDRLKLHRHHLRLAGRDYTVITPRPGTDGRFATNRCHGTWHILSDLRGARFLARLLWGLSYQRHPSTVVLIGAPFLEVAPFEAASSLPMVFAPAPAAPFGPGAARALKRQMPSGPGYGTVRWHTPGLDHLTDALLDAAAPIGPLPGALSSHFHHSLDGSRVLNYAEWSDLAAHDAAADNVEMYRIISETPGVCPTRGRMYLPHAHLSR